MKWGSWLSRHPVLMALLTLGLAALLAGPAYLYFRRQAQRRLDAKDGEA